MRDQSGFGSTPMVRMGFPIGLTTRLADTSYRGVSLSIAWGGSVRGSPASGAVGAADALGGGMGARRSRPNPALGAGVPGGWSARFTATEIRATESTSPASISTEAARASQVPIIGSSPVPAVPGGWLTRETTTTTTATTAGTISQVSGPRATDAPCSRQSRRAPPASTRSQVSKTSQALRSG